MKFWKVILATLVIYTAGVLTGGVLFRTFQPRQSPPLPPTIFQGPEWVQDGFVEKLRRELKLSDEQAARIRKILRESRERVRALVGIMWPELKTELDEVREKMAAEMTSAQREQFDRLMRDRKFRGVPQTDPHRRDRERERRPSTRPGEVPPSGPPGGPPSVPVPAPSR